MPTERMGPAARSFAADAHDCIMVRIQTDRPNTSVRREIRAQWRAPLGSSTQTGTDQSPKLCKSPSRRSSSLRVLRRQGAAKHKRRSASRQALLPFRSLDPSRALREPDRRRRDEERLSRSEQRTGTRPKTTTWQEKPHPGSNPVPSTEESANFQSLTAKRSRKRCSSGYWADYSGPRQPSL